MPSVLESLGIVRRDPLNPETIQWINRSNSQITKQDEVISWSPTNIVEATVTETLVVENSQPETIQWNFGKTPEVQESKPTINWLANK